MNISKIVAAVSLLAATSLAGAAVTINPLTGTGFVGKGDVQLAFGWNNQQLQANAAGVTFAYSATMSYIATCQWMTGEGTRGEQTHIVNRTVTSKLSGAVAYDARVKTQITGFTLTGFSGDPTSTGKVPVVGETCPGQGTDGQWTAVEAGSSKESLWASYGGASVDLLESGM